VEVVASDAASSTEVRKLAQSFAAKGGVDVLFLNAGIAKLGELTTLDEAVFDDVIRINVRGPWLGIKYFAPVMRRGGAVVVTSSVNDQIGLAGSGAYAASKAAVRALVRVAAAELVGAGVRVNAVSPGPIETPLHGKFGLPPEAMKSLADGLLSQIPMKRFGRPEEVARAALFLASDDSSYMTGEEIVLDGGMTTI
jgi:NAD(P)-dependent dehydrogenase (short-subunit alcohol dehydrogenase family)